MPSPRHTNYALSPLAAFREGQLIHRLVQLYAGLVCYGISMALMVRSELGVMPWDVLHQGVAIHVPVSFGTVVIVTSILVLALWIPLRQWPGLGTVSNALVIGVVVDAVLLLLEPPTGLAMRATFLVTGIVLNAIATAAYIGARFGPGPRDGLMTGLVRVTGRSVRLVRTVLEVAVVLGGWLLGGTVGLGTAAYALAIGPLVHAILPLLTVQPRATERRR